MSKFKAIIEHNRNGKFIDLAISSNELVLAIEVSMTSKNEKKNILDDFNKANVDYVIVACRDNKVLREVEQIILDLPEEMKNRSHAILISQMLKMEPEEIIQSVAGDINI